MAAQEPDIRARHMRPADGQVNQRSLAELAVAGDREARLARRYPAGMPGVRIGQ